MYLISHKHIITYSTGIFCLYQTLVITTYLIVHVALINKLHCGVGTEFVAYFMLGTTHQVQAKYKSLAWFLTG